MNLVASGLCGGGQWETDGRRGWSTMSRPLTPGAEEEGKVIKKWSWICVGRVCGENKKQEPLRLGM